MLLCTSFVSDTLADGRGNNVFLFCLHQPGVCFRSTDGQEGVGGSFMQFCNSCLGEDVLKLVSLVPLMAIRLCLCNISSELLTKLSLLGNDHFSESFIIQHLK